MSRTYMPSGKELVALVDPTERLKWVTPYVEHLEHGPWAVSDHASSWGRWCIMGREVVGAGRAMTAYGSEEACRIVCDALNLEHARYLMLKHDSRYCRECNSSLSNAQRRCLHCGYPSQ